MPSKETAKRKKGRKNRFPREIQRNGRRKTRKRKRKGLGPGNSLPRRVPAARPKAGQKKGRRTRESSQSTSVFLGFGVNRRERVRNGFEESGPGKKSRYEKKDDQVEENSFLMITQWFHENLLCHCERSEAILEIASSLRSSQ